MLTLYYRPTCPFCRQVLAVIDRMSLEVELKDVNESGVSDELVAVGGKMQVPFLVDTDNDVKMFESDAIVSHLQKTYGTTNAEPSRPRIHIADSVCVSCEG